MDTKNLMNEVERNEVFLQSQTIREKTFREWLDKREALIPEIDKIPTMQENIAANQSNIEKLKAKAHSHNNASVLDDLTEERVLRWDNKSDFSGNYNDLTNKPVIPSIEGLATEDFVEQSIEGLATEEFVEQSVSRLTNPVYINVLSFGVKEGKDVDVVENTRCFQQAIDHCKNDKVIVFPSGEFVFDSVDLGEKNNITIVGASSSFATFAQKNIYTGAITDTLTKIICDAEDGATFFTHKSCVLIMENIAFYNLKKDESGNFTKTEAKTNVLMQHTRSEGASKNTEKGKVFLTNCAFFGWKVCFGSDFTFQHLENEWGTGKRESDYEYFKQSCVMANRCRFTRNGVAINQSVDARIIDCSFNKNDYAIVFRENSGFSTVSNCRIEWNIYNGIYCDKAHEVTVSNCEFDCNGHAGLYVTNNTNSNFNGVFRRNGAKIESSDTSVNDYVNNVHIYAEGNINCNFIGSNTTVKPISDVGSAPERPTNCTNFVNNINCIVSLNNFTGCTKKDKVQANRFTNNTNSIIEKNMLTHVETSS